MNIESVERMLATVQAEKLSLVASSPQDDFISVLHDIEGQLLDIVRFNK